MKAILRTGRPAFSLAEVLIALVLIGVVAAFMVPKLLQNIETRKQQTLFKETYATLNEVLEAGNLSGVLPSGSLVNYMATRLNAVKTCPTASDTELCALPVQLTSTYASGEADEPGFILPNGVAIFGVGNGNPNGLGYSDGFFIDLNGDDAPNKIGTDQLYLGLCYGAGPCTTLQQQKAGTIRAYSNALFTDPERTENNLRFTALLN